MRPDETDCLVQQYTWLASHRAWLLRHTYLGFFLCIKRLAMRAVITKFSDLPSYCVQQLIELEKERLESPHISLEDVRKRHRHGSPSKERGATAKLLHGLKELVPSLQYTLLKGITKAKQQ